MCIRRWKLTHEFLYALIFFLIWNFTQLDSEIIKSRSYGIFNFMRLNEYAITKKEESYAFKIENCHSEI